MIDAITKVLGKVFGVKADKDLKILRPYADLVNVEYAKLANISDDELRNRTVQIKQRINQYLEEIDTKTAKLHKQIADKPDMTIREKEAIFSEIDTLEKERDEKLEEVLDKVLPIAFAVVKDTARRWKENKKMTVTATDYDRVIAQKRIAKGCKGVEITADGKAVWYNKWQVAGHDLEWEMLHYDVQLIGGVVLHQGKIAEMATGEGKTLVSTLPAFLNALAQRGVHIITVNDYLASRDAEWMAPLYEFHGMSVDCIDKHQPNTPQRKAAYDADITYGTNSAFGFDYLRDNMATRVDGLVQRKHHFAMIDEVDSVLIDDARTPLIISGAIEDGDKQEYDLFDPLIKKLHIQQLKDVQKFIKEAKDFIKKGKKGVDGAGTPLFRANRALPKYKPLIKLLGEEGNKQMMLKAENYYLDNKEAMMPEADKELLFITEEKGGNSVSLTQKGLAYITAEVPKMFKLLEAEGQALKDENIKDFFVMPDIGTALAQIDQNHNLSKEDKIAKKEHFISNFSIKAGRIHTINQLLKAYALFEIDVDYVVVDNKVKIVDEQTGRVMDGRRYSDGLHQALEAKEDVKIEDATQTYATITLQNYFRMYHKLSGMTGTAETEATEFWDIYELDVIVIPTNKPIVRDDRNDKVYRTQREKFGAVAEEVVRLRDAGQPVLVGTSSVDTSELVSRMLNMRKIEHKVLNAKQHAQEADVVAAAGQKGAITIATNMAGRGTDIKLSPEAKAAGGLAIVGTTRHESRRVDRQLRGRAGRQGDVGSSQFFVSLDDKLMRIFMPDKVVKIMDRMGLGDGEVIEHSMITKSIERAQRKVEENHFGSRKRTLEFDDVMNAQRKLIYKRRRHALYGERLTLDIMNMFFELCEDVVERTTGDFPNFQYECLRILGIEPNITKDEFSSLNTQDCAVKLYKEVYANYKKKREKIAELSFKVATDVRTNITSDPSGGANIRIQFQDEERELSVVVNLAQDIMFVPFTSLNIPPMDGIQNIIDTKGESIIQKMEQMMVLANIDDHWKEHLREMDDLRTQVNMASIEQKDPLLIYKFEGFGLFKELLAEVNEAVVGTLAKTDILEMSPEEIKHAQDARRKAEEASQRRMNANRSQDGSGDTAQQRAGAEAGQTREKVQPRKSLNMPKRNDVVTVKYKTGIVKKNIKFKSVERDVKLGNCVLM
jgi:preprotein translocase subunit SecA